jgi:hypothetical protein
MAYAKNAELNNPKFWYIVFDESIEQILGQSTTFEVITPQSPFEN